MIVKNSEKKENNKFEIQVASDAAEFEKAVNNAYLQNKKDIYIPGFRKGKAPRKVVEGMYGAEVFYQDAMDALAPEAFELGIKETGVKFVGGPAISDVKVTEEKTVEYTFVVELYPEVTLGQYKEIEVEKTVLEVTDEDIDDEIEAARKRNARKVSVERAAEMGDIANIDYAGSVDGVPFDGGSAEGHDLTLGSGSFIPGFEEQVVGMSIGEEKDISVTFPEEYHSKELAGKAAVFKVKLNEITVEELPELDDEFAKDNGFDTIDEYRTSIREDLQKKAEESASNQAKSNAMSKAMENMTVTIPEVMVNEKVEEIIRNYASNFGMNDRSYDFKQLCAMMGINDGIINTSIKPDAEKEVKRELLLNAIVEAEGFTVSEEDTAAYVQKVAASVGADVEVVKNYFGEEFLAAQQKMEMAQDLIFNTIKIAE